MGFLSKKKNSRIMLLWIGLGVLSAYYSIFSRFLPNGNGGMGHDFAFYLPALLDGYIWFKFNGIWQVPWFTPSFCGGSLNYPNINNGYYTLCQFLTFIFDPVTAVRINFLLYAGIGFLGFYALLRSGFKFGKDVSFLGACIFLFNGFYSHRMIIGHLSFCPFMLTPLIIYFCSRPVREDGAWRTGRAVYDMAAGGLLFCLMIQTGFSSMMVPTSISMIMVGLMHNVFYGSPRDFWIRFIGAAFLGMLFCLSKLMAIYFLMGSFPRQDYLLPGAKSFLDGAWLCFKSLFFGPSADGVFEKAMTNMQWALERHEREYNLTPIPLLFLFYGGILFFVRLRKKAFLFWNCSWTKKIQAGLIVILFLVPVAVNTYTPAWNDILKHIPIIRNSSSLVRWNVIYIPIMVVLSVFVIQKSGLSQKMRVIVATAGILSIILINCLTDRNFYESQSYNPDEIVTAYYRVSSGRWAPQITDIGACRDENGNLIMPLYRNNALAYGASQLFCYEPMFGYALEHFPIKKLRPGPVMFEENGIFNIKNPACYVWPKENGCMPGDHFKSHQKDDAKLFVNYRPYKINQPKAQKIANWVNLASLAGAAIYFLLYTGRAAFFPMNLGRIERSQENKE
jgi:hypothetical protein